MTVRFYILAADTEKELSTPTFKGLPATSKLFMHIMSLDQLKAVDDEMFVAELISDGEAITIEPEPVYEPVPPRAPELPIPFHDPDLDDPDAWRSQMG